MSLHLSILLALTHLGPAKGQRPTITINDNVNKVNNVNTGSSAAAMAGRGKPINVDEVAMPGTGEFRIRALHHNPHWECFDAKRDPTGYCKQQASELFNRLLGDHAIDFGSVVMAGDGFRPRSPYSWSVGTSSQDTATLIWDNTKWKLKKERTVEFQRGRAGKLGLFEHRYTGFRLVVASLHYAHTPQQHPSQGAWAVGRSIKKMLQGTANVLILADTNALQEPLSDHSRDSVRSSEQLVREFGLTMAHGVLTTPPLRTCCADTKPPFKLTFDRIFSNFGEQIRVLRDDLYSTETGHYRKAPEWARRVGKSKGPQTAAYHHPVLAEITVGPLRVGEL